MIYYKIITCLSAIHVKKENISSTQREAPDWFLITASLPPKEKSYPSITVTICMLFFIISPVLQAFLNITYFNSINIMHFRFGFFCSILCSFWIPSNWVYIHINFVSTGNKEFPHEIKTRSLTQKPDCLFWGSTRVWTQGFTLVSQVLYCLKLYPFVLWLFLR
jgi:hypothetical protein